MGAFSIYKQICGVPYTQPSKKLHCLAHGGCCLLAQQAIFLFLSYITWVDAAFCDYLFHDKVFDCSSMPSSLSQLMTK